MAINPASTLAADRELAVLAISRFRRTLQPKLDWQLGYLGDGSGDNNAVYTSQEHFVKVRLNSKGSAYSEVYCVAPNVPMVDGLLVKCGYTAYAPTLFQVLGPADPRVDGVSSDNETIIVPGTTTGYSMMGPHAISHLYLGVDPIYVNWRQITSLGVFPAGGMNIRIWAGTLPRPSGTVTISDQLIDMTSHIPGSGALFSLISFDATGTVVITDGTINPGGFLGLTNTDIPATPPGNWRSCAVVLYFGQTALSEARSEIDFWDLRFPEEQSAMSITTSDIGQTVLASQIFGG